MSSSISFLNIVFFLNFQVLSVFFIGKFIPDSSVYRGKIVFIMGNFVYSLQKNTPQHFFGALRICSTT